MSFYDNLFYFNGVFYIDVFKNYGNGTSFMLQINYCCGINDVTYSNILNTIGEKEKADLDFFVNIINSSIKKEIVNIDLHEYLMQDLPTGLVSEEYGETFLADFFAKNWLFRYKIYRIFDET